MIVTLADAIGFLRECDGIAISDELDGADMELLLDPEKPLRETVKEGLSFLRIISGYDSDPALGFYPEDNYEPTIEGSKLTLINHLKYETHIYLLKKWNAEAHYINNHPPFTPIPFPNGTNY